MVAGAALGRGRAAPRRYFALPVPWNQNRRCSAQVVTFFLSRGRNSGIDGWR